MRSVLTGPMAWRRRARSGSGGASLPPGHRARTDGKPPAACRYCRSLSATTSIGGQGCLTKSMAPSDVLAATEVVPLHATNLDYPRERPSGSCTGSIAMQGANTVDTTNQSPRWCIPAHAGQMACSQQCTSRAVHPEHAERNPGTLCQRQPVAPTSPFHPRAGRSGLAVLGHSRCRCIPACSADVSLPPHLAGFGTSSRVRGDLALMRARVVAPGASPRVRGGHVGQFPEADLKNGASPRVRGGPSGRPSSSTRPGCIPVGAGWTSRFGCCESFSWVHPRGCGADGLPIGGVLRCPGASPRVRGGPATQTLALVVGRCIPAGVGRTLPELGFTKQTSVFCFTLSSVGSQLYELLLSLHGQGVNPPRSLEL
jgi:hypothetical protein